MPDLLHEVWITSDSDSASIMLCLAGPDGDPSRRFLEPHARLLRTFTAGSSFEASATHHRLMGWEPYKPEPDWEDEPYTEEMRQRQQRQ